ncbi:MAG: hypothetical protein AAB875_06715, partial [Patescibacteria group bacterium]
MTPTPCCSGISGKAGIYAIDANTTLLVPGDSKRSGYFGSLSRHSNLTNTQIDSICAGTHLPKPPLTPTMQQGAAYDQCVADKRAERGEGRIQTFQSIGEWFATMLGRGGNQP